MVVTDNYIPDEATLDVQKTTFRAKKLARKDHTAAIPQVLNEELRPLLNRCYEFVTRTPRFCNLKSSLYLERNRPQEVQEETMCSEDVILQEERPKDEVWLKMMCKVS